MVTIIKAKPLPNGFWFQNSKWDILRVLRESPDFLVVVKESEDATPSLMTKKELYENHGTGFTIRNDSERFVITDGKVLKYVEEVLDADK